MKYKNYSVLMSVYYKEKPEYLEQSIESMLNQTISTNDFVLVCDGPIGESLSSIIELYKSKYKEIFNVIYLCKNQGQAKALNIGLVQCKNEIIMRMDSDDISIKNRCEQTINIFNKYKNVDIVSGTLFEFEKTIDNIIGKRVLPQSNNDIYKYAKYRCPFNHPCSAFKKTAVINAGNYLEMYLLEDYYLWIRMLINKSEGYNIDKPLLYMRCSDGMYNRRGGIKRMKSQHKLFKYMLDNNFINVFEYLFSIFIRTLSSFLPYKLRKLAYLKILSKRNN